MSRGFWEMYYLTVWKWHLKRMRAEVETIFARAYDSLMMPGKIRRVWLWQIFIFYSFKIFFEAILGFERFKIKLKSKLQFFLTTFLFYKIAKYFDWSFSEKFTSSFSKTGKVFINNLWIILKWYNFEEFNPNITWTSSYTSDHEGLTKHSTLSPLKN